MKNRWIVWAAALGAVWSLSACNTIHGMGQDIQRAGQAISKSSQ